jgi:hypothetical protein
MQHVRKFNSVYLIPKSSRARRVWDGVESKHLPNLRCNNFDHAHILIVEDCGADAAHAIHNSSAQFIKNDTGVQMQNLLLSRIFTQKLD